VLLPRIKAAFQASDRMQLRALTGECLRDMDLQEKLLATDAHFLVGAWLARVPAWAGSEAERAVLDYDARSIMTSWGEREASQAGGLHDYANRDWAGLVGDYYRGRWQRFFASLDTALARRAAPEAIDWYAMADAWNRRGNHYPDQPQGDAYAVALEVARVLGMTPAGQSAAQHWP
jgi:alpha-N-acetylglucosaminidase